MLHYKYTAKIYFGEKVSMQLAGDEVAELYLWMLARANENQHAGVVHGEIVDNETKEIIQQFRRTDE